MIEAAGLPDRGRLLGMRVYLSGISRASQAPGHITDAQAFVCLLRPCALKN